jgi:hypothetical protein
MQQLQYISLYTEEPVLITFRMRMHQIQKFYRPVPRIFSGGRIEHRRCENRGAEGGGVRGGGVPLPAEKCLYFKYENDAFWCIFAGVGVKIRLPIPPINKRPRFHALITIG